MRIYFPNQNATHRSCVQRELVGVVHSTVLQISHSYSTVNGDWGFLQLFNRWRHYSYQL